MCSAGLLWSSTPRPLCRSAVVTLVPSTVATRTSPAPSIQAIRVRPFQTTARGSANQHQAPEPISTRAAYGPGPFPSWLVHTLADVPALDARHVIRPYSFAEAERLERELGVSHVLAQVLVRRGMGAPDVARGF